MMVFKDSGGHREYQHIQCDEPGCETTSPPADEVLKGHGLVNMGWECSGGKHRCPMHAGPNPAFALGRSTNPQLSCDTAHTGN